MNFSLQELRYYEDFEELYADSYKASFAFINANPQFQGRTILPSLDLAPFKPTTPAMPLKTDTVSANQIQTLSNNYAAYMLALSRKRDPQLAAQVAKYVSSIFRPGMSNKTLQTAIRQQFPSLKLRQSVPQAVTV